MSREFLLTLYVSTKPSMQDTIGNIKPPVAAELAPPAAALEASLGAALEMSFAAPLVAALAAALEPWALSSYDTVSAAAVPATAPAFESRDLSLASTSPVSSYASTLSLG